MALVSIINDVKELLIKSLIDAQQSRIHAENEKKILLGAGFLKLKGLPLLPKSKVSISRASYGNHQLFHLEPVDHVKDVVIGIPSCCKISELEEDLPSLIWKQTERNEMEKYGRILLSWNNEVEIERYVYYVIMDIIALLKLNPRVKVCRQEQITLVEHLTPDIIVMELNGKLIGICEVKQPSFGKSDLSDLDKNHTYRFSRWVHCDTRRWKIELFHRKGFKVWYIVIPLEVRMLCHNAIP